MLVEMRRKILHFHNHRRSNRRRNWGKKSIIKKCSRNRFDYDNLDLVVLENSASFFSLSLYVNSDKLVLMPPSLFLLMSGISEEKFETDSSLSLPVATISKTESK